MTFSTQRINLFLLAKLPAAYLCGVRVRSLDSQSCETTVRHRWINQNPFRSLYFAVQAMAAELSTGALVLSQIRETNRNISMLVGASRSQFFKKATGRISFTCCDGVLVSEAISSAIRSGEGQTVTLRSIGKNQSGDIVSQMEFDWQIRLK